MLSVAQIFSGQENKIHIFIVIIAIPLFNMASRNVKSKLLLFSHPLLKNKSNFKVFSAREPNLTFKKIKIVSLFSKCTVTCQNDDISVP